MFRAIAGVDGCGGGWVAVTRGKRGLLEARAFPTFAGLVDAMDDEAVIAVDMPIGLPERGEKGGRACERAARSALGRARSSIFSIPSRAAVEAERGPFGGMAAIALAHSRAVDVARRTSDPPAGFSRQAFMIFPKIREIDALLRGRPGLAGRVIESHPEAAFRRMNGGRDLRHPKKLKGRVHAPGMAERERLLAGESFDGGWFAAGLAEARGACPAGLRIGRDDVIDACAMLVVAARYARAEAVSFPDPPGRDAHGLPVAIWV